ncbi:MAG TPA: hypothetical protein VEK08_16675 [Planctomycetota bacterium]|nr:hypothetical protein [Planctomycetota bacterium]
MADWLNKVTGLLKSKKPLAEVLPQMLDPGDPRVVIRIFGDDWLCPYTARRVVCPDWNGSSLTLLQCNEIREHLLALPELQKLGVEAQMKSFDELAGICVFQRIQAGGNYKFAAPSGEWVCPYCLKKTEVLLRNWDGSEAEFKIYLPHILAHFKSCDDYQQDPVGGAKEVTQIIESGGDRAKLARYLATDPRFQIFSNEGLWLDPFSARTVESLNIKREPWGPALQSKILDYILSEKCPGKYSQFEVELGLDVLKKAANTKTMSY